MQLTHYQRLKLVREKNNRTQEEIADAFGMTRSGYSLIETGKAKLTPLHLSILEEKFKFDIDYIINGSEHDEKLIVPELKKEQISRRLRQLRESNGQDMHEVSKGTKINVNTLYAYERGKMQPGLPKVKQLAKHFGVPIEYILHGKKKESNSSSQPSEIPQWGKELIEQISWIKDIILKMQAGGFQGGNLATDNVFPFHPNRQSEKIVIGWD